MEKVMILEKSIQRKIYNIRGVQVMLDRDLAKLYKVDTKVLNQAMKRNLERFPASFMFQLTNIEFNNWRSQFVTSNQDRMGLRRAPYVFTEQGVSMLSAVLKSNIAIKVSISIIESFVSMRRLISDNSLVLNKMEILEKKQLKTDNKVNCILNAIENKEVKIKSQIIFNGKIFDAHILLSKLIRKANKDIVLIDNYIDESVLSLLTKKKKTCKATIYTKAINKTLKLDLEKHNQQYPEIKIQVFKKSHDRFLILDKKEVYLIGASLKDLGKKISTISKLEMSARSILKALK